MHTVSQIIPNNAITAMCQVTRKQCATCGIILKGIGRGQKFPLSFEPGMSHGICEPCKEATLAAFRDARRRPHDLAR